jgi:putative membrane protein
MMDGWDSGWGWGDWLAISLILVACISVLVGAVALLVGVMSRSSDYVGMPGDSAHRMLDEGFARGDIDDDEYDRLLEALKR